MTNLIEVYNCDVNFDFLKDIQNDDTIKKPLWVSAEFNPKTGYVRDGVDWIKHFK